MRTFRPDRRAAKERWRMFLLPCFFGSMVSAANADPALGTREVLLDNEYVEVVRLSYPVGTESGMHGHAYDHRAIYVVSGGRLEVIPADSTQASRIIDIQDGQAVFMPAATHNVRNVGDTDIILIETEIK